MSNLLPDGSSAPRSPVWSSECDAIFFVSEVPGGDSSLVQQIDLVSLDVSTLFEYDDWITHLAVHDGYESVDSVWIPPADAVKEEAQGKRTIIFPTLRNLEKLATWRSPEEAISNTLRSTVVPVLPWTEKREDGNYLCIPTEAGYAISEEKMPERKAK
ncbi:MAG: hypothetical protein HOL49_01000 [Gammaproteobacteria bacterium]|nr:hypothetical protein [Gammaproteobacteria bacterium]